MIKTVWPMTTLPTANEQSAAVPATAITASGLSREYPELAAFENGIFFLDISALTSTGTLDVTIEGLNPLTATAAQKWHTVVTFAQQSATTSGLITPQDIPLLYQVYRARWVIAGGTWTFTVGCIARTVAESFA